MRSVSFFACATAAVLCAAPLSAQQGHTALHTTVEQRDLNRLQARLASPEGLRLLEVRDAQGRAAPIPAADRDGVTPMVHAERRNQPAMAALLRAADGR